MFIDYVCTFTQDLNGSSGHGTTSTALGRFKNLLGRKTFKSHSTITRTTTTSLPQSNAQHLSDGNTSDDDDDDEEVQDYVIIIITLWLDLCIHSPKFSLVA